MATTEEQDVEQPPEGLIARVGGTAYRVVSESIVPDARSRSLTPALLVIGLGALIPLIGLPWAVVGGALVAALAYWLGARG